MTRDLSLSTDMIFIPYRLPEGAEDRGYAPWLREVDNPFFNAIPGIHHYANWKRTAMLRGATPGWDWFDFKGLTAADDLERVWFSPELDGFRRKWLALWGYGTGAEKPAFLRYSYLFGLTHASGQPTTDSAVVTCGSGAAPADRGDLFWQRKGFLPKHFAADAEAAADAPWLLDTVSPDPLGFDWIRVGASDCAVGDFAFRAAKVAAPDLLLREQTSR